MRKPLTFLAYFGAALVCTLSAVVVRAAVTPAEVVDRAEYVLWGKTLQADFEMTIKTPSWTRALSLKVWMDRPGKSFLRVVAPAKDQGISSLRIGNEMWNYIPAIERTIKIPPSLMLQPWLGSDFTNDDLVKESSIVLDYTHRMLASPDADNGRDYVVEALPKPNAAVVWGKIHYTVRKDFVPLKQEYFNERGELVRTLTYSEVKTFDGHLLPTRWDMVPADKPGKSTTIEVRAARYDAPIDTAQFTQRTLTRKD